MSIEADRQLSAAAASVIGYRSSPTHHIVQLPSRASQLYQITIWSHETINVAPSLVADYTVSQKNVTLFIEKRPTSLCAFWRVASFYKVQYEHIKRDMNWTCTWVCFKFPGACFCQKLAESDEIWQRYHKNKKGDVFLRHSVLANEWMSDVVYIRNALATFASKLYIQQKFNS